MTIKLIKFLMNHKLNKGSLFHDLFIDSIHKQCCNFSQLCLHVYYYQMLMLLRHYIVLKVFK